MVAPTRPLDEVQVAAPCHVAWDNMIGTQRIRYCHQCRRNVYNLSAMGREEAETLVQRHEGRLCIRFFRRADGTMLTQDCPVGRRGLGWYLYGRWLLLAAALANLVIVFFGVAAIGFEKRGQSLRQLEPFSSIMDLFGSSAPPVMEEEPSTLPMITSGRECIMGEMVLPTPVLQPNFVPEPVGDPDAK